MKAKEFKVIGSNGRTMVRIGSNRNFGWIAVNGKKDYLVGIGANESGYGVVSTHSPKGKATVKIGAAKSGYGSVSTYGPKGKATVKIFGGCFVQAA